MAVWITQNMYYLSVDKMNIKVNKEYQSKLSIDLV